MRILVEHPCFTPYTGQVHGGTERFAYTAVEALQLVGHDVYLYAPADSTLPCIRSRAMSAAGSKAAGTLFKPKPWYDGLFGTDHDAILLNTTLYSPVLLDPAYAGHFRRCTYLNHNGSNWFTRGFAGRQLNVILRYFRSCGGRAYFMSEANKAALEEDWDRPGGREQCLHGKVEPGLRRVQDPDFLATDLFDGHFDQSVFPPDAVPARASEGYLVAIGRDDREKRLDLAVKKSVELGRELRLIAPDLGMSHGEIMAVLAGAEALLLSSRNETFSIVAFEAVCHGVPVSCIEVPPALHPFPFLTWNWGRWLPTTYEERVAVQTEARTTWSIDALGRRLEQAITCRGR